MQAQPKQEIHYGEQVWVNPTTESLRRTECLCLNCDNLKPGQPDNCDIGQAFYEICAGKLTYTNRFGREVTLEKENTAMAITRCPLWKPKS